MARERPISRHSCQMTKISGQFLIFGNFRKTGTPATRRLDRPLQVAAMWWHIRGALAESRGACRGMAGAALVGGGAIAGLCDAPPLRPPPPPAPPPPRPAVTCTPARCIRLRSTASLCPGSELHIIHS